jgi:hypothetical protein
LSQPRIARIKLRGFVEGFYDLRRAPALNNDPEKQVAEDYGGAAGKDQDAQIHQNGFECIHN